MSQNNIVLTSVVNKIKDLCEDLINDNEIRKLLSKKQNLENNKPAMQKIQELIKMEMELMEKQKNNQDISDQEINEYDNYYNECKKDELVNEYLEYQEQIHQIAHIVSDYVSLTLTKGKVPTVEDVNEYSHH